MEIGGLRGFIDVREPYLRFQGVFSYDSWYNVLMQLRKDHTGNDPRRIP